MIEANQNADKDAAEKIVTRSITHYMFPTLKFGIQRRASPRINAKTTQVGNVARGRRGLKSSGSRKATTSVGNQHKGMVDVKYLPHLHQ